MPHFRPKLKDIGERQFLSNIAHLVDTPLLGYNEDASALCLPSGENLIINVDMLVGKTDVLPGMSHLQIGKKAITMSISDIIAKGAKPLGCLLSVGFPANMLVEDAENLVAGAHEMCKEYDCLFLGGDTNEASDIVVDAVAFGLCQNENPIPRKGAKYGDLLFSTGYFGFTSLGFKHFLEGLEIASSLLKRVLQSVYKPKARLAYLELFKEVPPKICMDSSDGLAITLSELSSINGLNIELSQIPIAESVLKFATNNGLDALDLAFNGGEEFELIFAISPESEKDLLEAASNLGLTLLPIGSFTSEGNIINIKDSRFSDTKLLQREGYQHFRI